MNDSVVRIAMWSGPRNISTALMRAWENRPDTIVCDEPFYAHYLEVTGDAHPGADDIIAHDETDPRHVVANLTRDLSGPETIFYQKHMGQHILPGFSLDWLKGFRVGFLIRSPAEMIASYLKVRGTITLEETGLPQQVALFKQVSQRIQGVPPVLDAADVLRNPGLMLKALCKVFEVPFVDTMLSWPPGPRESDGVWAKHWYSQVEQSTGFAPYQQREVEVPDGYGDVVTQCNELYDFLHRNRLTGQGQEVA